MTIRECPLIVVIFLLLHYACHYRAHAVMSHYVALVAKKLKSCLIVFHILIANILPQDNVTTMRQTMLKTGLH